MNSDKPIPPPHRSSRCEHCGVFTEETASAFEYIAEALHGLGLALAEGADFDAKGMSSLLWVLGAYAQACIDAETEEHRKARKGGRDE